MFDIKEQYKNSGLWLFLNKHLKFKSCYAITYWATMDGRLLQHWRTTSHLMISSMESTVKCKADHHETQLLRKQEEINTINAI